MDGLGTYQIILFAAVVGIFIVPFILFLITLQNTLKLVRPENQKMKPGYVWLMFIPLFNVIWQYFVVVRVAESLRLEFIEREIPLEKPYPGKSIGITYAVLSTLSFLPTIGTILSFAGLICWIFYWVEISKYKSKLAVFDFPTLDNGEF